MAVNNVTRMLDAKNIPYTAYDLPAEKLGARRTAVLLGVPPELVYKTIVVTRSQPGKPILTLIPGTNKVDLKLVASALGEKKVNLPTEREAERLTGLQAGGISPLALLNKGFQVIVDSQVEPNTEIYVSAGQRGLNICLAVKDLLDLTRARVAVISLPGGEIGE